MQRNKNSPVLGPTVKSCSSTPGFSPWRIHLPTSQLWLAKQHTSIWTAVSQCGWQSSDICRDLIQSSWDLMGKKKSIDLSGFGSVLLLVFFDDLYNTDMRISLLKHTEHMVLISPLPWWQGRNCAGSQDIEKHSLFCILLLIFTSLWKVEITVKKITNILFYNLCLLLKAKAQSNIVKCKFVCVHKNDESVLDWNER